MKKTTPKQSPPPIIPTPKSRRRLTVRLHDWSWNELAWTADMFNLTLQDAAAYAIYEYVEKRRHKSACRWHARQKAKAKAAAKK